MTSMDPQSRAFREATEDDSWDGNLVELLGDGGRYHEAITDVSQVRLPDGYETGSGWDAGRGSPKTISEAREALLARIADPGAPDTEDDAGAYDDLDGD